MICAIAGVSNRERGCSVDRSGPLRALSPAYASLPLWYTATNEVGFASAGPLDRPPPRRRSGRRCWRRARRCLHGGYGNAACPPSLSSKRQQNVFVTEDWAKRSIQFPEVCRFDFSRVMEVRGGIASFFKKKDPAKQPAKQPAHDGKKRERPPALRTDPDGE